MVKKARISLAAVAAMCADIVGANASAQTTAPRATPAAAAFMYCPLSARVRELDDTQTRYVMNFRSLETGRASGTLALWAGARRFDVPFRDAVALDWRDRTTPETPLVVRFAAPTPLDGAAVTARSCR